MVVVASPDAVRLLEDLAGAGAVGVRLGATARSPGEDALAIWRAAARLGWRQPNVFLKVTGLGEFARRAMPVPRNAFPFERPIPSYLEQAHAAFGAGRLMWGSDFPPVAGREGYALALRLCREQFAACSEAERDLIFGGVAATVFPCG